MSAPVDAGQLQRALQRVKSIAEGESGVLQVIACGTDAIPALRRLLFAREPSGLYEPRRHVVEALDALKAHDVLIDFLATPRAISDPVERVGEEAVRNAAARALVHCNDPRLPSLLLGMAETWHSPGAIEVLGAWRRAEALACMVAALGDDIARPAAEAALRDFGAAAVPILRRAATDIRPHRGAESESSRRRRRSVLALLLEAGCFAGAELPNDIASLRADEHPEIAAIACQMQLASGPAATRRVAARRSIDLLTRVNQIVRADIEDALVAHADITRGVLPEIAPVAQPAVDDRSPAAMAARTLRRVATRIGYAQS